MVACWKYDGGQNVKEKNVGVELEMLFIVAESVV